MGARLRRTILTAITLSLALVGLSVAQVASASKSVPQLAPTGECDQALDPSCLDLGLPTTEEVPEPTIPEADGHESAPSPTAPPERDEGTVVEAGSKASLQEAASKTIVRARARVRKAPPTDPVLSAHPIVPNAARVRVAKVTSPAGFEAGWSFTLVGPGAESGLTVTTEGPGFVAFFDKPVGDPSRIPFPLHEGSYTITETLQDGWAPDKTSCSFDVIYPADTGRTFECTFTNTLEPARVKVVKTTDPAGFEADWSFALNLLGDPNPEETFIECTQCASVNTPRLAGGEVVQTDTTGQATFSTPLSAGRYTVTESQRPGWTVTPSSGTCAIEVVYPRDAGHVFLCSFHNTRVPMTPPPTTPPPPPTPIADVTIVKSDSQDPVVAGDNFDYELTATNNGPDPAHNTVVSDTIPDELASVVDVTTSLGSCTYTRTVTCQLGTLNPGASVTITVTVATQPGLAAELLNTAVVSTTTLESNTTNNQDSEPTTVVVPEPDQGVIVIEKQTLPDGSPDTFLFGGDVGGRLGDGDTVSAVVDPGTYFSHETTTISDDWTLESIVCDDADSSGDRASATAMFVVAEGETVTCTFTNSETEVDPVFIPPDPTGDPPVEETPAEVGPRALPVTGRDLSGLVAFGLLSLLVGATTLVGVRRASGRHP